jgi:hypothetical protein
MVGDLVKRFSSTPLAAVLSLNGILVRVATNNQHVLDRLEAESAASGGDGRKGPCVDWRIVVEQEGDSSDSEFSPHAFTHDTLSFIRIANRSFLAGDGQARCGISFIASNLIEDDRLFGQYFLPAFISILGEMKEEA